MPSELCWTTTYLMFVLHILELLLKVLTLYCCRCANMSEGSDTLSEDCLSGAALPCWDNLLVCLAGLALLEFC